jgi:hypothetical protein
MSSRSYADSLTDDQIVYHIALRHQGRLWLRAFEQSRATNSSFRVFRKQAVNEWTDLGLFRVVESQTTGDEAFLKLARATTDAPV